MAELNTEERLRAWATVFTAAADLQHEIVEQAMELPPMEQGWLQPFRNVVYGTFETLKDRTVSQDVAHALWVYRENLREEVLRRKVS